MCTQTRTTSLRARPRPLQRHRHQPAAMALAVERRDQAEKGEFALTGITEIQFQYADLDPAPVGDAQIIASGWWMMAASSASGITSRENHSQGSPTRR